MPDRAACGRLPADLASFIGRQPELADIRRLLTDARLVTLTGVGGTGKTRLALRTATQARRTFADGVWFVDLTELRSLGPLAGEAEDPHVLASLVSTALGLPDQGGARPVERLTGHLADLQALLVLDNCEHLLPACAVLINRLLRACPHLRILATSRERIAVQGETVFAVQPLPIPRAMNPRRQGDFDSCESVELFVARAQAVSPGFSLNAGNRAAVAEICRRLDGLPLAIELAAARLRVLTPDQILARFADRFAVLGRGSRVVPMRQQTLHGCMDWSYELCAKPEQLLWGRLAVFVGGFELDAVDGVCADEALPADGLLDLITSLVDKSIVVRDDDGVGDVARFRMLATIREFGQERLAEAEGKEALNRRHRDWYRRLVDQAAAEWISHRQEYWMARLTREHPNVRAAVEYCLAERRQADAVLHIAVSLPGLYWWSGGLLAEGRRWLDVALAQAVEPTTLRARALLFNSQMADTQQQTEVASRLLAEGEALAQKLDATAELALAAHVRAHALLYQGDLPGAMEALESMRAILLELPQTTSGFALDLHLGQLVSLGTAAGLAGDHQRAEACYQELVMITELRGEIRLRSYALWAQALSAWRRGKTDEAATSLTAGLRLRQTQESTDLYGAARCVEAMAWLVCHCQQYARAATLLGAADALWIEAATPITTIGYLIDHRNTCERQTRDALGDTAYQEAYRRGLALSHDDAIAFALDEPRSQPAAPLPDTLIRLTRRERQVADLVGQGMSNKTIAQRLVISQRTAESHVEHILAKLGVASRAQIAAWAARHELHGE